MKCMLQDMMNSYRSACSATPFKKTTSVALTLFFVVFFSALQLILDHSLHNTDWILNECILVSDNDYISSKISFDPYQPDALLSMFRSQATSLCFT